MKKTVKVFVGILFLSTSIAYAATTIFSDVAADHWASESIDWVNSTGLMKGPGDKPGLFEPGEPVNRAQLATAMQRFYSFLHGDVVTMERKLTQMEKRIEDLEEQLGIEPGSSVLHPLVDSRLTLAEALEDLSPVCPEKIKQRQVLVDVLYVSFDGKIHQGQIVVDKDLAPDVVAVFKVILEEKFPVESVIPVSRFAWSDDQSMDANNSSAFNYRHIAGSPNLSEHAKGWALDINPKLNPFIKGVNSEIVQPAGAVYDPSKPGTLTPDSPIVKKFEALGWEWGGTWETNSQGIPVKDYQHFEKTPVGV
jgi:peptidoglycan L-alanyl-D-glutamate endopeptidase CwlK